MAYRILIVDDQREVSRLLKSALETIEQGLVVSEAPSGEEAILEASRTRVDLLIADFRLPGITGLELMTKIRARNPAVKVILITGVSDPKLLRELASAGADAYFSKPVPMGDFLDAVERTLGLARTILQKPAQKDEPVVDETRKGLSEVLVTLRKDLGAEAAILINAMGHVEAEAGQLPDPNKSVSLISSLMGMFNAAQKVASLLDRAENHLHLFDSDNVDGIFLPIGPTHALLLLGKAISDPRKLSEKVDRLFTARIEILDALKNIGITVEAVTEPRKQVLAIEEPFTQPEDLPREFMNIFNQIGKKVEEKADPDAFWDSVVEKGTTFTQPDKLTYEQASKLGLTPDSAQNP